MAAPSIAAADASRLEQLEARLSRLEQVEARARASHLEQEAAHDSVAHSSKLRKRGGEEGGTEGDTKRRKVEGQLAEERAAAAEERAAAAERRAAAAEARAFQAEADAAALKESLAAATRRAVAAEAAALAEQEARKQQAASQQAAAAVMSEKVNATEAKVAAAEAAAADALAEVQRVREDEAQKQAECESLRATLRGIREAGQCSIRHSLCREPVVASDGHTYDRQAIEPWLQGHGTSPLTRAPLQRQLYPNHFAAAVLRQLGEVGFGASEAADGAESSAGSLNPQDGADPEPEALHDAICGRQDAAALGLLRRPRLPGLNVVHRDGISLLNLAIANHLSNVAVAILARADFTMLNARMGDEGLTCLHLAAFLGLPDVCQAILARADFTEALAVTNDGLSALQIAQAKGHGEAIVALLGGAR